MRYLISVIILTPRIFYKKIKMFLRANTTLSISYNTFQTSAYIHAYL